MNTERAKEILKEACMNYTEFSKILGVKPVTVRLAISNKRLSKKMVAELTKLGESQDEDKAREERRMVKEGMIKQTMGSERMAKVYMLPKNPYLRFIEFEDGSHGRINAKPGTFGLGTVVKVKREDGDLWRLTGNYDRKDRLI